MVSKAPDRTDWVKSQNSLSYLELFYSVDRVQLNVHSAQDSSHKENPCPAELVVLAELLAILLVAG